MKNTRAYSTKECSNVDESSTEKSYRKGDHSSNEGYNVNIGETRRHNIIMMNATACSTEENGTVGEFSSEKSYREGESLSDHLSDEGSNGFYPNKAMKSLSLEEVRQPISAEDLAPSDFMLSDDIREDYDADHHEHEDYFLTDGEDGYGERGPARCHRLGFSQGDGREVYYIYVKDGSRTKSRCINILKSISCESGFIRCSTRFPNVFYAVLDEKQAAMLEGNDQVYGVCPESDILVLH